MRPAAPCQRCGRLIEHPRGPQRYCTDCRIALDRERRAAYAAAHRGGKPKPKEPQPLGIRSGKRGYIRICVVCGKVMRGVGNKTKYCPECRHERENARARERGRPRGSGRGRRRRAELRPICGPERRSDPMKYRFIAALAAVLLALAAWQVRQMRTLAAAVDRLA